MLHVCIYSNFYCIDAEKKRLLVLFALKQKDWIGEQLVDKYKLSGRHGQPILHPPFAESQKSIVKAHTNHIVKGKESHKIKIPYKAKFPYTFTWISNAKHCCLTQT